MCRHAVVIGLVISVLLALGGPACGQTPPAALGVQHQAHGYEAWAKGLMRFSGKPAQLGLWLDKERYDTLDVSGGAFVHLAPEAAKPDLRVALRIIRSKGAGPGGALLRETVLSAEKGDMAVDVNVKGLAPGEYALGCEVRRGPKVLYARTAPFRVEAAAQPKVARERVGVTVRNPAGRAACREPAYAAVALHKGRLYDAGRARVVTADGTAVPAQMKVQNRWDRLGSVQWLGAWFTLDHAEGTSETPLFFEYGQSVRPVRGGGAGLGVVTTEAGWVVTNGPLQVHLDGQSGRAIERVFFDADKDGRFAKGELAYDATKGGAYLVTDDGQRYEAAADRKPSVAVEENGPECLVLRTESWYVGKQKPAYGDDPGVCRQVTRVRIQRNVPRVDVSHTWIMTARSFEARFSDIGLAGRVPGARRVLFGLDEGVLAERIAERSAFHLLQHRWNQFDVDMRSFQKGHYVAYKKDRPKLTSIAAGNHAPGWGALVNDRVGVAVGCEDFWQNYPKEVSVDGDTLTFHTWPAHGRDHEREVGDDTLTALHWLHESRILNFLVPAEVVNHPHRSWHTAKYFLHNAGQADAIGISKTQHVRICFFKADQSPEHVDQQTRAALQPTVAVPDPSAVVGSGVLGPVGVRDPTRFPRVESQIEGMFKGEIRLQELARDFGMFIYGDGHSGYRLDERRFNVYRAWRNTHHNVCRTPWMLYLRSGDPFYLRAGLRNARRTFDIGFCHHSRPGLEKLPWGPGKRKGALCDYKGLVPWHSGSRNPDYNSMTDFMYLYTYLTGDDRGRDIAQEWWACTQQVGYPPGASRNCSATLCALLNMYEATWDRRMLPLIHACYRSQVSAQHPTWGYFPHWENYAPWIDRYWLFTGSEHARQVLVKWADAFLTGWGDMSIRWGTYLNVPAMAYYASGDVKYLRHVNSILWQEVRSSYHDPGSPLHHMYRSGHVSLAHYYMQRAVFAMEALRRHGTAPGLGETPWAIHPKSTGFRKVEKFIEFWVLDEDDQPIRMLIFGLARGPKWRLTAWAPDGKVALTREFKTNKIMTHGSTQRAPQCFQTIPPDGKTGVYRVRVEDPAGSYLSLFVPFSDHNKEVYPCTTPGELGLRAGRAYFALPKDSGKYAISLRWQKGGPFPSYVYDDKGKMLARGTLEQRSDGDILRGYPLVVDSAKCQRYMVMSNRGTATFFTFQGKHPPKYIAASFERLFDPDRVAQRP